jgi:hypothetical protein
MIHSKFNHTTSLPSGHSGLSGASTQPSVSSGVSCGIDPFLVYNIIIPYLPAN